MARRITVVHSRPGGEKKRADKRIFTGRTGHVSKEKSGAKLGWPRKKGGGPPEKVAS